jgi:hypothetical protein
MVSVVRSVLLYLTINSLRTVLLVSIRELPTSDTIVDVNKGYALRLIGTYSFNMEEQVVHTFVLLNEGDFILDRKIEMVSYNRHML